MLRKWIWAVALVVAVSGCRALPPDVQQQLLSARQHAEALAVAGDATERERESGQIMADALWQVQYATGAVDELPADVRARSEARAAGGSVAVEDEKGSE